MLIGLEYFENAPLHIEGLNNGNTLSAKSISGEVCRFIEVYQDEYLDNILGRELKAEVLEYIENEESEDEDMNGLIGMLTSYNGVELRSPIANYVFFHYVRLNNIHATSLGTTENASDNRIVKPDGLVVRAWNDMARMNAGIMCYLKEKFRGRFRFNTEMLETINFLGI